MLNVGLTTSVNPGTLFLVLRRRGISDQFQSILDEDLARHFPKRRAGHVFVALEAVEIDLGEDVAEGIVREAEKKRVVGVHFPLDEEADVW